MNRILIVVGLLCARFAVAESTGAPVRHTGAPGEDTCATSCHVGVPNSGPGKITITFPGTGTYTPGQTVRMRVTVEDPDAVRWGFSLTARREASNEFVGAFAVPPAPPTVLRVLAPQGSPDRYITHNSPGTYPGQRTQAAWEFDWTAPVSGTGTVRFYAAGNGANGNGQNTGDRIYTTNLAVAEASGPPPIISAGTTILPQFVFGGGWTSSLYFTNNSGAQVSFPVRFFNDSAAEMSFAGGSVKQLILSPRATALIQAQNTGSLQQGWATFDLPTGVTGYGVFRQASLPPAPDQEAVVPFAPTNGSRVSLTYDDSNLVTATAIWFNGSQQGTVTVTAFDEAGIQVGTANITMVPGTKVAFALRERIPSVENRRGTVEFSAPTGTIAVLGLRFTNAAFTSIPAVQ